MDFCKVRKKPRSSKNSRSN